MRRIVIVFVAALSCINSSYGEDRIGWINVGDVRYVRVLLYKHPSQTFRRYKVSKTLSDSEITQLFKSPLNQVNAEDYPMYSEYEHFSDIVVGVNDREFKFKVSGTEDLQWIKFSTVGDGVSSSVAKELYDPNMKVASALNVHEMLGYSFLKTYAFLYSLVFVITILAYSKIRSKKTGVSTQ